jgi:hypothetical protein
MKTTYILYIKIEEVSKVPGLRNKNMTSISIQSRVAFINQCPQ